MRDYIYTEELKRLLREHPLGLTLREMHYAAEEYGIPANHAYNYRTHESNCYSTQLANALAYLLRDGDVWSPVGMDGRFVLVEVKYA